ncbi:MAG TPA: glutamine--tRNA ligase, partial [Spirochaetota bacterium]|nr:glutamine--tRNA ligase [Spirochaetota bacterium]
CSYDPATKGGWSEDGRMVKGTSHWVSASKGIKIEVRLYDKLFLKPDPEVVGENEKFTDFINPDSIKILSDCIAEPSLAEAKAGDNFQFLRQGYFVADKDGTKEKPVFNRSVGLKDSWAKTQSKNQ